MTKSNYSPSELDALALRFLDIAAALRRMGRQCRDEDLDTAQIHDRKALLWLDQLEEWIAKSSSVVDAQTVRAQARRRAKEFTREAAS